MGMGIAPDNGFDREFYRERIDDLEGRLNAANNWIEVYTGAVTILVNKLSTFTEVPAKTLLEDAFKAAIQDLLRKEQEKGVQFPPSKPLL